VSIAALIPHDKALHCLGGVVLFGAARVVALALGGTAAEVAIAAYAVVVIAACAKEAYDLRNRAKHTPDLRDAAATAIGGLIALACSL
jgi:ABC-type nickel/cobalt efflux system permease component RcnA